MNSEALTIEPDQNERIRLMIQMAEPAVAAFDLMDWCLTYTRGNEKFITADGPMGLIPLLDALPAYGELSPNVLRFLSLSPTVCLRLADRRDSLPILSTRLAGDLEVADINAAIAQAATRIIIGRDEVDVEKVLKATALRTSTFIPRTGLVEWYDEIGNCSLPLSVRTHQDSVFPLCLPLPWKCKTCGNDFLERFEVTATLQPLRPQHYTEWL